MNFDQSNDKLFIGILGKQDAGKSTTWYKLLDERYCIENPTEYRKQTGEKN